MNSAALLREFRSLGLMNIPRKNKNNGDNRNKLRKGVLGSTRTPVKRTNLGGGRSIIMVRNPNNKKQEYFIKKINRGRYHLYKREKILNQSKLGRTYKNLNKLIERNVNVQRRKPDNFYYYVYIKK